MHYFSDIYSPMLNQLTTFDNAEILGSTALALSSILSLYLLLKQVLHHEKTKSSKNNSSLSDVDNLKAHSLALYQNLQHDLGRWTSELKGDYKHFYEFFSQSLVETQRLMHKNAEQIASLVAQSNFHQQRINELSIKNDKVMEKLCAQNKT